MPPPSSPPRGLSCDGNHFLTNLRERVCFHIHRRRLSLGGLVYVSLSCATSIAQETLRTQSDQGQLPVVTISAPSSPETTERTRAYTAGSMNTATGMELSIRETPQSVSVVTRQQIDDRNLQTTAAILLSAPGISATRSDSNRYSLSARGFVIDNVQFDGLASPILSQWNYGATGLSSIIYDRVEVVRGATGLMTGAGNPSAAVNFIRKRPLDRFSASTVVSVGRWNNRSVSADVSSPLTSDGKVRARFVAETSDGDSYVSWLDSHGKTLYGVVTVDLTATTRFTGGIEHQENINNGFGGGFPLFYGDGSRTDFDRSVANNTRWARMETVSTTGLVDLTHRFASGWRVRGAYSRNRGEYDMRQLFRGGYPDRQTGAGMTASFNNYKGNRHRDEFNIALSGPFSFLGRTHEASLGWMRAVDNNHIARYLPTGASPSIGSFFSWRSDHTSEPAWSSQSVPADDRLARQTGAYAVGRFSLMDPLHFILGVRVGNWEIDQLSFGAPQKYRYSNQILPYAGAVYDINDIYSVYTGYTEIFTPQNARSADGAILPPIKGKSYEAGIKAAFLDGVLNGSASIFQTRQENLAHVIPGQMVAGQPNTSAYRAVSGAKIEGIELELAGQLNPDWQLSGSYTRFVARDASGKSFNTTQPSSSLKLFSTYRASEKLTFGGGMDWQNRIYQTAASPLGNVVVVQESYAVANVMAKYQLNKQLSAALNINNLFDKKYYSQIGSFSQG